MVLTSGPRVAEREERGAMGDAGPRGSGPAALLGYGGKEIWVALNCCWAAGENEKDGEQQAFGPYCGRNNFSIFQSFSIFLFQSKFKYDPNQIQIEFQIYFSTHVKMSNFSKSSQK